MNLDAIIPITVILLFLLIILIWSYCLLEIANKIFEKHSIIKAIYQGLCTSVSVVVTTLIAYILSNAFV